MWKLAHPLEDMEDIIMLGEQYWSVEGLSVLKKDREYFRQCLTVSCTNQLFDKNREFIAVDRNDKDQITSYCWFDRGGYTTYSKEEISNAKFHHVDLLLPLRTRIRLIKEMIEQHILWCNRIGVPIICSTSIRGEHDGFMRIHKKMGFEVHGSYAWMRTEEGMKKWQ